MTNLVKSFDLPSYLNINFGDGNVFEIYEDKIKVGKEKVYFADVVEFKPSIDDDGFYIELINGESISIHITTKKLFKKRKIKKISYEILETILPAYSNFKNGKVNVVWEN